MKPRYLARSLLTVAVVAILIVAWQSGGTPKAAVVLRVHSITNDAAGYSVAVLTLTKHRTVAVTPDSFASNAGDSWSRHPLPSNQVAEVEALAGFSFHDQGSRPAMNAVHFPTNTPWRLRLEVVEPQSGIAGAVERFTHPTGFYRKGGVLNVLFGFKPCRYTGRAYYIESEEIR